MTNFVRIAKPITLAVENINGLPNHNKIFTVTKQGAWVEPYVITIRDSVTGRERTFPEELANFDQAYQGYSATQVTAFLNGWLVSYNLINNREVTA